MAAAQTTFGIILLLIGSAVLLLGAGTAIYGAMHEEERGPFGLGGDEEERQLAQALVVGGTIAALFGAVMAVIGIVVLSTSRARVPDPNAQLGGPEPAEPGRADVARRLSLGAATVLAVVGALLLAGFVLGSETGPLSSSAEPRLLATQHYEGRLQNSGALLGQSNAPDTEQMQAPATTRLARIALSWEPVDEQSQRLRLNLEVQEQGAWRTVNSKTMSPGQTMDAADVDLAGAQVRITVAPVDQTFVMDQRFAVSVTFYR